MSEGEFCISSHPPPLVRLTVIGSRFGAPESSSAQPGPQTSSSQAVRQIGSVPYYW